MCPFTAMPTSLPPSHLSFTLTTAHLFSITNILSFQKFCLNGIVQFVTFEDGLFHSASFPRDSAKLV